MASAMYVLVLTVTFAVLANAQMSSKRSYCQMETCTKGPHTICNYPFLGVSPQCGSVERSGLTPAEIRELVDVHNKYRAFVASGKEKRGNPGPQPAARDMEPLKWDKELAAVAQTWANQCQFNHDFCRDSERFKVGQNIAKWKTTGPLDTSVTELVNLWYNEVELFDRRQIPAFTKVKKVGHYTQMMWAKTNLIGCGAVRYNNDGEWNVLYLVCNYGPAGNILDREIYKTR